MIHENKIANVYLAEVNLILEGKHISKGNTPTELNATKFRKYFMETPSLHPVYFFAGGGTKKEGKGEGREGRSFNRSYS